MHSTPPLCRTSVRKMYIIRPLCRTNKLHSSRRRTKRLTALHYFRFLVSCVPPALQILKHRSVHYRNYSLRCVASQPYKWRRRRRSTRDAQQASPPHDLFACSGACWLGLVGDPYTLLLLGTLAQIVAPSSNVSAAIYPWPAFYRTESVHPHNQQQYASWESISSQSLYFFHWLN
jgi:hypothetical protein